VPNRPDFVAAAPTLPGVPRVRLPPASPSRYDDQAMQVSHLHPKQQRLVAHDVLVDPDHGDAVEPADLVDKDTLALGQDRVVGGVPRHFEAFGDAGDG